MSQINKFLLKVLTAESDKNIKFSELINLMLNLKFDMRISGSHHIFRHPDVPQRINLQKDGNLAKAYQVKQVRNVIIENNLRIEDENKL